MKRHRELVDDGGVMGIEAGVEPARTSQRERYASNTNTSVVRLRQPDEIDDSLTDDLRAGARRVYIAKADGGRRPLCVPILEDKIVQDAVAETLSAIREVDFLGFSYGLRPKRTPHQALSSLHTAIMSRRVDWVLDADIRSFFDSVDHEWLLRMLAQRIADPRVLRLIRMWLVGGILEINELYETTRGTPQGAGISPLLANVFLHYVLDLWVHQWRRRRARGQVSIVRYADDFVMGFENGTDARRMLADLKARLAEFGLIESHTLR